MRTLLISLCLLCLAGCAMNREPQVTTKGFATELVRSERNGITVDVYYKAKDQDLPTPVYHYAQRAGMLGQVGEPNLQIKVIASDTVTSATTYMSKSKRALTSMTGMVVGAIGGAAGAGVPGATVGAAAGSIAGKVADNFMPE